MPVINRVAELSDEIAAWRRDIHAHPELGYEEKRTSAIVAEKLKAFGCDEIVTSIAKTGVVGVIRGRSSASGKVIGMRADMDCLPLQEIGDIAHKSTIPNRMHACGHDGHTSMLLGAARYLCETRNFDGTAVVIFQPAEEGGAGGELMVKEGIMERFGIREVYGMHNMPGLPPGHFALRPGPMLAAADRFEIEIEGKGAHAAKAYEGIDTVVVAAHMITALQSIVSRNVDALKSGVVSVTYMRGGDAFNIIPQTVTLRGTVRTLEPQVRDLIEARIRNVVEHMAAVFGARAKVDYGRGYPVTRNHEVETGYAAEAAADVAGSANVMTNIAPSMGGEDFSYMLLERPGAMILVGNGDTAGLHHPAYDFNDAAIAAGVSYWARLAERRMPA
ncbi:hippurate hydrolase [Rhizobiales bacterium GAS191]|nr:hippurate hydrolase [Rhizobiales bacterium GAS191]